MIKELASHHRIIDYEDDDDNHQRVIIGSETMKTRAITAYGASTLFSARLCSREGNFSRRIDTRKLSRVLHDHSVSLSIRQIEIKVAPLIGKHVQQRNCLTKVVKKIDVRTCKKHLELHSLDRQQRQRKTRKQQNWCILLKTCIVTSK